MRRSISLALAGALVLCKSSAVATTAVSAAEIIDNSASPPGAREVMRPESTWALGGESESDDEFFGVVRRAATTVDGTTYLLDEQLNEVRAVDARGVVVTRFGREGGGPGEFTRPRDLFVLPDGRIGVVHGFPARISTFGPDGSIAEDLPIGNGDDPAMIFELQSAGGRIVAVRNRVQRNDTTMRVTRSLVELGLDGRSVRTYLEKTEELPMLGGGPGRGRGPSARLMRGDDFVVSWSLAPDGRLFVVRQPDRYEIEVLGPDGGTERVVRRAYTRVARTPAEMRVLEQREAAIAERTGGNGGRVDRHRNDIARVIARDDGSVWVLSSAGLARERDDVLGIFDVFDANGRFVREVEIAVAFDADRDEFQIVGNALFVFEEAIDAARGMTAGRGGGMFNLPPSDEDGEAEPLSLRIVRYELTARS
jgi:hypothetical protein